MTLVTGENRRLLVLTLVTLEINMISKVNNVNLKQPLKFCNSYVYHVKMSFSLWQLKLHV